MQSRALTTMIWSAVTCHRFHRFGDWSPKQGRVSTARQQLHALAAFDGDKSPAEKRGQVRALQSL